MVIRINPLNMLTQGFSATMNIDSPAGLRRIEISFEGSRLRSREQRARCHPSSRDVVASEYETYRIISIRVDFIVSTSNNLISHPAEQHGIAEWIRHRVWSISHAVPGIQTDHVIELHYQKLETVTSSRRSLTLQSKRDELKQLGYTQRLEDTPLFSNTLLNLVKMAPPSSSNNKKRSAPSSGPQGNKKPRFAPGKSNAQSSSNGHSNKGKSDKPVRRGGQNVTREPKKPEPEAKRKAPITGRKYEEDLEEEEDVDMDDLDEDEFDEEDIEMADGEVDGEEKLAHGGAEGIDGEAAKRLSKGKSPPHPAPKHTKPELISSFPHPAEKAALHAQQPHRTTLLPSHPLLKDTLLPLWEDARRADLSKEERNKKIKGLYEAVKGRVREVGRGHKGGRVLQTVSRLSFSYIIMDTRSRSNALGLTDREAWRQGGAKRDCDRARWTVQADVGEQVQQVLDGQTDPTLVSVRVPSRKAGPHADPSPCHLQSFHPSLDDLATLPSYPPPHLPLARHHPPR